jgi:pimeloyl-ACP methyl ester carboxylesterase
MTEDVKNIVLLIHGWGGNSSTSFYLEICNDLKKSGFEVVTIDLPNSYNQSFNLSYTSVENIIQKFKGLNINIIAHSSGGYLACKIAENYILDKVLLIAPASPSIQWSKKRTDDVDNWLKDDTLKNYIDYHSKEIDLASVRKNIEHLEIIFGLDDPYIDETNRDYYIRGIENFEKLYIFEEVGHMTGQEWPVKFAVESLFKSQSILL